MALADCENGAMLEDQVEAVVATAEIKTLDTIKRRNNTYDSYRVYVSYLQYSRDTAQLV